MKRIIRIVLILVVLLVLAGIGALFFIGTIVKSGVEKVGPMVTKVPMKLGSAKVSVFGGSGELKDFVIGNPEGFKTPQAIKVGTVSLSLAPGSVLKDKVLIRQIKVEAPEITYETGLTGSNLGKILENVQGSAKQDEQAPTKKEQTTKTKLQVDEFVITGARVTVAATLLGGTGVPIVLPDIHLKDLGTGPEGITPAELSQKVLSALLNSTTKAVTESATKIGQGATDAAKAVGITTTDQFKKASSGVTDLFKSKK